MRKTVYLLALVMIFVNVCACNNVENGVETTTSTTALSVEEPTETVPNETTGNMAESTTADTASIIKKDVVPVVRGTLAAGNGFVLGVGENGEAIIVKPAADKTAGINFNNVAVWDELIAVAVGDYDVIGLKNDGTVWSLKLSLGSWSDIVQVAAGKDNVAGLKKDGTVEYKGMTNIAGIREWTDIIQVSAGAGFVAGLKSDKTVVSAGENRLGQCETDNWTDVEMLVTGEGHTVGLRSNGTVLAAGLNLFGECDVTEWNDIIYVAAGRYITIGIKGDGSVVVTGLNADKYMDDLGTWTDMVSVSVNAGIVAGVTGSGNVIISSIEIYPDVTSLSIRVPQNNIVTDSTKELRVVEQKCVTDMNIIKPEIFEMDNDTIKTEDGLFLKFENELADRIFCTAAVDDTGEKVMVVYLKSDVGIYLHGKDISCEYAALGYFYRLEMKDALKALVAEIQPTWLVGDETVRKQVNDSFIKVMSDVATEDGNTYKNYKLINDDGSVSIDNHMADLFLKNIDKLDLEEVYVYVFSTATDYQISNDENLQEYREVQNKLINSIVIRDN